MFNFSPFLPVQSSWWPLLCSFNLFSLILNVLFWVNLKVSFGFVLFIFSIVLLTVYLWWKDLSNESVLGYHTHKLEACLRVGMLLFILSEIFFFLSFFWAFYDFSLAPSVELGLAWPPKGIMPLSAFSVPLLNTIILISSGLTVTWAHHAILNNRYGVFVFSLFLTVALGVYFLIMQWLEYSEASFGISDGSFGSIFFMGTGFHGMHVLIGTLFLLTVFVSSLKGLLLPHHHFSFEGAAWYWHFVDVVWLFLFLNFYVLSSL